MINIKENKAKFIDIANSIVRYKDNVPKLLEWLETTDFYEAPASARYHMSEPGGLCQHCLNVYEDLCELHNLYKYRLCKQYDEDSLKIVALFHDLSKVNFYNKQAKNVKVYSESGTKSDELGRFDWKSEMGYGYREDIFMYGNHEQTAEYLLHCFVPLTIDESVAVLHHMGGMSKDCAQDNIAKIFTTYPLAFLLHKADCVATYIDERK